MKQNKQYTAIFIIFILFLSGCGTDTKENPVPPVGVVDGYTFNNFTNELNITTYDNYRIEFQLTKDGIALPLSVVSMKVFDSNLGSVQSLTAITDEDGKGFFLYTPPKVFPESGTLTISYTNGDIVLNATIQLMFNLEPGTSPGRATTLSIVYETSECDDKRGLIGHYHVHAVDRFSRLPLVGIPVKVSLVNGVREISGEKLQKSGGNIRNTTPVSFYDNTINFDTQTNILEGDNLIIFPTENKTDISYLGGWNIDSVGQELTLDGEYTNLINATNLTYIVGNEERLLGGEDGEVGILANAHVEMIESVTDTQGYAYFDIVFDPALAGHTVSVEAHGDEDGKRVGIAQKEFLRLDGEFTAPETVIENDGSTQTFDIPISIQPSCMGEQALIDTPIDFDSFTIEPQAHCDIVKAAPFETDQFGNVSVTVSTDGNTTATGGQDECTLTWEADASSLGYEY